MKYVLMFAAALIFSACSSTPKEHCEDCEKETAAAHAGHDMAGHDHAAMMDAKNKMGQRDCCSEGAKCSKTESTCKMDMASMTGMEGVTTPMSKEELTKHYTANKSKLGKTCSPAASAYCGKVTRDLNVTEDEVSCLYSKVFRSTKEAMPKLDNTECAKLIKNFAGGSTKVR